MSTWEHLKKWTGMSKKRTDPNLYKSQYSLASTDEVTADTLKIWMGLPDEVKYDPALAQFKQLYEKENGKLKNEKIKSSGSPKRLPLVKSAPALSLSLKLFRDDHSNDHTFKALQKIDENETNEAVENNEGSDNGQNAKVDRAKHCVKLTLLLACWVFFTAIFLMYNEKEVTVFNSSVAPGEVKSYIIQIPDDNLRILLEMTGPFLSEHTEIKLNESELQNYDKMELWLERWTLKSDYGNSTDEEDISYREKSIVWSIVMDNVDMNFIKGEPRSFVLNLKSSDTSLLLNRTAYAIRMRTTADRTTPFTFSYTKDPVNVDVGIIYAGVLLCGLYVLIIFEVMNRTMAAITVSTMSLAALALVGERPSVMEIMSWLDVETLLLLFSMMLLVAIMAETGIFDFLAVFIFEVTKGKLWPLIYLLGGFTALISTFLDNVTTVLLMSPVTLRLCEVMDLDPVPILIFLAMFSNIGGLATPVGDPPNVIVASNKAVVQSGITFASFTAHMFLGVSLILIQTSLQLKYKFKDTSKLRLSVPRDVQDLSHQISIWRRAVDSLPHLSRDVQIVRERLERKIKKLIAELVVMIKESKKRACPKDTYQSTLADLKEKYKIRDKILLMKSSVALIFVVALFFLHVIPEMNRVSLAWTALLGAILLLILSDRPDLEPVLHRIEWSTLLFFAALFVLMEALSKLGLIIFVGGLMESLILQVDESARLATAIMVVLWVSGALSVFVDDIPLTTMMIRVVVSIGSNPVLNLPLSPLIWALLFGACLGGNGTLIGSSANVVCAGVAEQHGYKISFGRYFRIGFPIMLGHLIVASVYLLISHCVFTWH